MRAPPQNIKAAGAMAVPSPHLSQGAARNGARQMQCSGCWRSRGQNERAQRLEIGIEVINLFLDALTCVGMMRSGS